MGRAPARSGALLDIGGPVHLTVMDPSTRLVDGSTNDDHPGAPPPQLPPLLQRPEPLAHRHLADAGGHLVAHLPAHRLGDAARDPRLRRADPHLLPGPAGRRARRPVGPLPRAARRPDPGHGAVRAAGGAGPLRGHQRVARARAQRLPGPHQRLRHAGAAVDGGGDGGRSRRSAQRHRPQLVDGQRRAAPRARHRRRRHRRGGRGLVLRHRHPELRRRDHLAPVDADRAAPEGGQVDAGAGRDGGGLSLRDGFRAHPLGAAPAFGRLPHGGALHGPAPGHRPRGARRRPGTLGMLTAASGVGALGSALFLASRKGSSAWTASSSAPRPSSAWALRSSPAPRSSGWRCR